MIKLVKNIEYYINFMYNYNVFCDLRYIYVLFTINYISVIISYTGFFVLVYKKIIMINSNKLRNKIKFYFKINLREQ